MRTVDVRVLLPDDVDAARFVEQLFEHHAQVLGATQLVPDSVQYENGCGDYLVPSHVHTRPDVDWDGLD